MSLYEILVVMFTGVIAFIAVITFVRGIPSKKDIDNLRNELRLEISHFGDRFDRHLEYHAHQSQED